MVVTEIARAGARCGRSRAARRCHHAARHMIGLATDDLAGDWKRLKAAGVEFVEAPTDYDTVSIATLKDPEGNLIQLIQRRP